MKKWLAIVMTFALAFTQIGAISFADLHLVAAIDMNAIVQPQKNINLPIEPYEFPSEPKPYWSGGVLTDGYFSYNEKLYPIDLQYLVENVRIQKKPYTFYYLEKETPFFQYNGDPVRLENNQVISKSNGTVYGELQSKQITAEVRKDGDYKYILKLTGLKSGMLPQYSKVSVDSDQNSVEYKPSNNIGEELKNAPGEFEWWVELESGHFNLDGHICFIAALYPEDPDTISPYEYSRHRLPSIVIPFGEVSASPAFGTHSYYVLKKELGDTFALDLGGRFDFLKDFAIGNDQQRTVTRYAYRYSFNEEEAMQDFVDLESSQFSMKLDNPGVYFFYFIGLDANQTRKTMVGATNYYIYVPNPYAPKLRDGIEARNTLILETEAEKKVQFADLFEVHQDSMGLKYQVWKNGEILNLGDNTVEYIIKGEDARAVYKFVASTYEGAVACDFIVMTQALYDASVAAESNHTSNDTGVDSGTEYFPGATEYVAQSSPIEFDDKDFLGVIETIDVGHAEYVQIGGKGNQKQDKMVAKLTPSALKVLNEKGLFFTNDIAQILLPPDVMDFVSEEKAMSISVERKDPKKQVANVDMKTAVSVVEVKIKSGEEPVTEFGGGSISIQLPADDTYKLGQAYRVIVVSEDGTVEEAIGICKLEQGVKVVSVPIMHLSTFILTSERKAQFTDIPEKAWYEEGAKFTFERGIITSADQEKFEGMTTIPRIEIVMMLHRLAGKPTAETEATYADIQQGTWYSAALNWATENGVVNGVGKEQFGLYTPVTREQFLVMLQRYAEKMEILLPQTRDIKIYEDSDRISEYAKNAIQWAGTARLVEGSNGMILPRENITKAEIATILTRFVKAYEEAASQDAKNDVQPQQASSEKTPENQK